MTVPVVDLRAIADDACVRARDFPQPVVAIQGLHIASCARGLGEVALFERLKDDTDKPPTGS